MALVNKIYYAAMLIFLFGMIFLCVGDLWTQLWPGITVPLGIALSFTGGIVGLVSGIVLLIAPGNKA